VAFGRGSTPKERQRHGEGGKERGGGGGGGGGGGWGAGVAGGLGGGRDSDSEPVEKTSLAYLVLSGTSQFVGGRQVGI